MHTLFDFYCALSVSIANHMKIYLIENKTLKCQEKCEGYR